MHVVYDGVGKDTFAKNLKVMRPRGYVVLFGGASAPVPPFDLLELSKHGSLFVTRRVCSITCHTRRAGKAPGVLQMIVRGELKMRIHQTYPLADTQQAHRDLEEGRPGKLLSIP